MNRNYFTPLFTVLVLALPGVAAADWNEFWAQFEKDRQRNQAWPIPFNQADQQSVRSIFGTMVRKGWDQQIVFQEIHFDKKTNELNALGQKKLRWILQNVPPERAALYVQKSLDNEVTSARLENLQIAAAELTQGDELLQAAPVRTRPILMRGENADAQITAARRVTPTFIPASQGSPSGSSN